MVRTWKAYGSIALLVALCLACGKVSDTEEPEGGEGATGGDSSSSSGGGGGAAATVCEPCRSTALFCKTGFPESVDLFRSEVDEEGCTVESDLMRGSYTISCAEEQWCWSDTHCVAYELTDGVLRTQGEDGGSGLQCIGFEPEP
jgi:hypothetical protein